MAFKFTGTEIPGIVVIEPVVYRDSRGFFMETYKASEFSGAGISYEFVQDNHSMSDRGVLRGLHYQIEPAQQGKLIRVVSGSIFDVALDIRRGSPTFGRYLAFRLTAEEKKMVWIPPGFAHGFLSLEDGTELLYKATSEYNASLERGILWNDPDLKIDWPSNNPIVSEKDSEHPRLKDADLGYPAKTEEEKQ